MNKFVIALLLSVGVVGCASTPSDTGPKKAATKNPDAEVYKPMPVSSVFNRPTSTTKVSFDSDGKFRSITATGTASIHGNNAASIEQAVSVATMRAKRNLAEFIATDLNSNRTIKVLSHTVQRGLENVSNGSEQELTVTDADFNPDGTAINGTGEQATSTDNQNSQKIAETVKETISSNSRELLRGVYVINEQIDNSGRTVQVEVRADIQSIGSAKSIRELMSN